jgi:Mrp family chromosome partitioning ATPase
LAALVVGVLLGVGTAFVRDRLDDHLRGPLDFERVTGASALVTVPVPVLVLNDDPTARMTGAIPAPDSVQAEAYRYLRAKIEKVAATRQRNSTAVRQPVLVAVTSAARDDGAVLVAAGAAQALARAGRRVVLAAGDVRADGWPELFDVEGRPGVTDVLSGRASLADALRPSPVEGMAVLSRGTEPSSREELFDVPSLHQLVEGLPGDVDYLVVLTPPVLAAAASLTWADVAHEVILVAAVGQTVRRELGAAASELAAARGHLLGGLVFDRPMPAGLSAAPPPVSDVAEVPTQNAAPGADPDASRQDEGLPTEGLERKHYVRRGG